MQTWTDFQSRKLEPDFFGEELDPKLGSRFYNLCGIGIGIGTISYFSFCITESGGSSRTIYVRNHNPIFFFWSFEGRGGGGERLELGGLTVNNFQFRLPKTESDFPNWI
jgi:hypothetical protein